MDIPLDALQSQIPSVGVTYDASLRQRLEELESAVERLDARSCVRATEGLEESDGEAGIYERCVRGLPQFGSLDAEVSACPVCSHGPHGTQGRPVLANVPRNPALPGHIQQEVDWRRQHTELLHQQISMLERENAMWEKKLKIMESRSPGTSPKNKIVQLFPKERQTQEVEQDMQGPVHPEGHAFAMLAYEPEIATLLGAPGSAREVFEKMRHPHALQPLQPKPPKSLTPQLEVRTSSKHSAGEADLAAKEAEAERLQAEQRESLARRAELKRGLQDELQQMQLLEGERRKRREQKRAELDDELQQQLRQEKKDWQIRQARQELERKERKQRHEAAHQELLLVELERLRDRISLKQLNAAQDHAQPLQPTEEARLEELLQVKVTMLADVAWELRVPESDEGLLTLKHFDWNEWLSSVKVFLELTPQVRGELEAALPDSGKAVSLLDVEVASKDASLAGQVRSGLRQWMRAEGDRQAQKLQLTLDSWVLFYGDLLSGRSRDKEADVLVLEKAFMAIAMTAGDGGSGGCALPLFGIREALASSSLPKLQKQMLRRWLDGMTKEHGEALQAPKVSRMARTVPPEEESIAQSGRDHRTGKSLSADLADRGKDKDNIGHPVQAAKTKVQTEHPEMEVASAPAPAASESAPASQPEVLTRVRSHAAEEKGDQLAQDKLQNTAEKTYVANLLARTQNDAADRPQSKLEAEDKHSEPHEHGISTTLQALHAKSGADAGTPHSEAEEYREKPEKTAKAAESSIAASKPGKDGQDGEAKDLRSLSLEAGAKQTSHASGRGSRASSLSMKPEQPPSDSVPSQAIAKRKSLQASAETLSHPREAAVQSDEVTGQAVRKQALSVDVGGSSGHDPHPAAQAPKPRGAGEPEATDDKERDQKANAAEEEEDDRFVKEQWLDWFLSAELSTEEEELLRAAFSSLSSSLPLSTEAVRGALKAHEKQATPAEKEQLQEWSQWVLEMNDD